MRCNFILISFLCLFQFGLAQKQVSRIKKEAIPEKAYTLISKYLEEAKRVRFYQITDETKQRFEAKFKKGRLHYSVEFNTKGELEDVEFEIKQYDIPEDTWDGIKNYLDTKYPKLHIKKIQQRHPLVEKNPEKTVHEAFQNLMLPYINYKIIFSDKTAGKSQSYEALFNAEGSLVWERALF